ncbi:DUF3108 domain-containing protein [Aquimarina agarivorans]|uniref:DUF3108 domain-containing protein n=1 Tax=Aquimarina agarivorans TaxID=980584 RepID=UPI000248EFB6|nr:DUF3108 domain-containing protein [Aquimarina agarivorans]
MKKVIVYITVLFGFIAGFSQVVPNEPVFSENEFIEFKIKYLSFNTSTATLETKKETLNGKEVYHVVGKGRSSKFLSFFFKIRDQYETIIDAETYLPYRFVRNINEGGYTKNIVIDFDQNNNKAHVNNKKHKTNKTYDVVPNVHDMLSSFYYLRNVIEPSKLKEGDEETLTMFFDEENFKFKLRFLGNETIRTKYGKKSCLKFRPLVMADRVFKEEESLTVWISNDENKIPVRISADLAVGSLTASLSNYSGLKHPFVTN